MPEMIWDSAMAAYVRARLYEWADYYQPRREGIVSHTNTMKRHLLREGALIQPCYDKDQAMTGDQAAAEMEYYLKEMAKQYPIIAKTLRCHYKPNSSQAKILELKQKGVNLTLDAFERYVDLGHCWLAGRMTSKTMVGSALFKNDLKDLSDE